MLGKVANSDVISCAGATHTAILQNVYNVLNGFDPQPLIDIYVNNNLIAANISATFINQHWFSNNALKNNAQALGYSVNGGSDGSQAFTQTGNSDVTFKIVPKQDGVYNGNTYTAAGANNIANANSNPTLYKDQAGVITFCLKGTG